jgi:hypothetical protein
MVAFLFLFAPTVVLIAVLLLQLFQPRSDPAMVTGPVRVEPRFAAVPEVEISDLGTEGAAAQEEASAITLQR